MLIRLEINGLRESLKIFLSSAAKDYFDLILCFIERIMAIEKILASWKKKDFQPVYWLEGEEDFYIDQVIQYAEHHILTEDEAGFNRTVFYGRDAQWADIVNACKRYPMFSERQVVILKEAQQMKEIDKLEAYIQNPLSSTIFVVAYKEKKVDSRTKFAKVLKEKAVMVTTKKMYDSQLPTWAHELIAAKGFVCHARAVQLLVDHIGNDLSRINNEIDKLVINLGGRKEITEDDIEKFIGISKEYNTIELQSAIIHKNLAKAIQIVQYFESNPKAAPIQMILPLLYGHFSKAYMVLGVKSKDEKTIAATIGIPPFAVKDYLTSVRNYGFEGIQQALLLLHVYNLRSIGIGDSGTSSAALLKEMIYKMML